MPRWRKRAALASRLAPVAAVAVRNDRDLERRESVLVGDDALVGAWDTQVREKIRATFVVLKEGPQIFNRVDDTLDGYRRAWITMRRATCEATRVRGEQSETLLDLRMACLDRKRDELRTVTHGLAEADQQVAMGAARAALGLSAIAECGDRVALSAPIHPPEQELRARIEAERSALAEVRGLRLLGKVEPALEKAEAIASRAKELKYRPLEAEALLALGDLKDRAGDSAAAIKLLEQAVVAADAGNHKLVAAEAWSALAWLQGYQLREFERAQWAVQMAGAAIEALGGNPELAAQLVNYEALVLEAKGQLQAAKAKYLEALAARERIGGSEWKLALVLNDLGVIERKLGNLAASRQDHDRALAIRKQVFGEHHPYTFSSLTNLGAVAWSEGDYAGSEQYFRSALAVAEAIFPPQHPQTALALKNLGSLFEQQRRFTDSIATFRRAVAMYEATRGPNHPDVADALHSLANVLAHVDQLADARQAYSRALAIYEAKAGDDPELAALLEDFGELLVRLPDQRKQGEVMLQRSIELATKADANDPDLAYALTALGEHCAATGRAKQALPLLERALALRGKDMPLTSRRAPSSLSQKSSGLPIRSVRASSRPRRARTSSRQRRSRTSSIATSRNGSTAIADRALRRRRSRSGTHRRRAIQEYKGAWPSSRASTTSSRCSRKTTPSSVSIARSRSSSSRIETRRFPAISTCAGTRTFRSYT